MNASVLSTRYYLFYGNNVATFCIASYLQEFRVLFRRYKINLIILIHFFPLRWTSPHCHLSWDIIWRTDLLSLWRQLKACFLRRCSKSHSLVREVRPGLLVPKPSPAPHCQCPEAEAFAPDKRGTPRGSHTWRTGTVTVRLRLYRCCHVLKTEEGFGHKDPWTQEEGKNKQENPDLERTVSDLYILGNTLSHIVYGWSFSL